MSKYTVGGVRYKSAREAQRARRKHVLERVTSNKGIRSKLWNLFSSNKQKDQAKKDLEDMRRGGHGYKMY